MPKTKPRKWPHILGNVIGIVMIAILLPMMIVNVTLIVRGFTTPDQVPRFFGVAPLIVDSGSMYPRIMVYDLILVREVDAYTLTEGDIIAFQLGGPESLTTHRIVEIHEEDGVLYFITRGEANNVNDPDPVREDQVVGIFTRRFAGLGRVADFLQRPVGMALFLGIPILLFVLYDMLRRRSFNKQKQLEENKDKAEIARLRAAMAASAEQQPEAPLAESKPTESAPAYPIVPGEEVLDDIDLDDEDEV